MVCRLDHDAAGGAVRRTGYPENDAHLEREKIKPRSTLALAIDTLRARAGFWSTTIYQHQARCLDRA